MESCVHKLKLRVVAEADHAESSRQLAERYARAVLEELCRRLEARSPGRVILIHRLALCWSLSEEEMADPAEAVRSAADLADRIHPRTGGARANEDGASEAVVFDDEAAWLASYLRSCAARSPDAWYHAAWRKNGLARSLQSPSGPGTLVGALSRLAAAGDLRRVLVGLDPATVLLVARVLDIGVSEHASSSTARAASLGSQSWGAVSRATRAGRIPEMPLNLSGDAAAIAQYVEASISSLREEPASSNPKWAPVSEVLIPSPSESQPSRASLPDRVAHESSTEADSKVLITAYGGLFYLLAPAMELGIGEMLWKACLPEGDVLARVATAMLGPESACDPAPVLFGGVEAPSATALASVSPEQQEEICGELLPSTIAALPRRGLAFLPAVELGLLESPAGRLLAAFCHKPFTLFAWPAPDPRATAAGIELFLKSWPVSAPRPRAARVLATLDPSGRINAAPASASPQQLILASASSPSATALLAQLCGSVLSLFAARAGIDAENGSADFAEFVSQFLALPARIVLGAEDLTIVMRMDDIDISLRRAALDRDPGWVPWLRKTVRFEFEDLGATRG